MSQFNISEQLGVVVLGFAIYDAVDGSWSMKLAGVVFAKGDFSFLRGTLVFVLCLLIAASISISHKTNSDVFADTTKNVFENSQKMVKQSGKFVWLSFIFAAAALAVAYFGMGPRQAFLVWAGFALINFSPMAQRLSSKL